MSRWRGTALMTTLWLAALTTAAHAQSLRLDSIAATRAVAAATEERGHDSVLNGVLIGAGVGAALGLIPDYYDDCEECHDSLYVSIAVGAGVGLFVDLMMRNGKPRTPAQAAGFRMEVAMSPRLLRVGGRWAWR
jgi:ElaB/YqjD/DUF883 family membrane-anchored ribosome-binding protein